MKLQYLLIINSAIEWLFYMSRNISRRFQSATWLFIELSFNEKRVKKNMELSTPWAH